MKHLDTLRAVLRLHETAQPAHYGRNDGMSHPIKDAYWTDVKEALEWAIKAAEQHIQDMADANEMFERFIEEEKLERQTNSIYDPDKRTLPVEPSYAGVDQGERQEGSCSLGIGTV